MSTCRIVSSRPVCATYEVPAWLVIYYRKFYIRTQKWKIQNYCNVPNTLYLIKQLPLVASDQGFTFYFKLICPFRTFQEIGDIIEAFLLYQKPGKESGKLTYWDLSPQENKTKQIQKPSFYFLNTKDFSTYILKWLILLEKNTKYLRSSDNAWLLQNLCFGAIYMIFWLRAKGIYLPYRNRMVDSLSFLD